MDQLLNEGYQSSIYSEIIGNLQCSNVRNENIAYEHKKSIAFNMMKPEISQDATGYISCENLIHHINKSKCHIFGGGKSVYDAINQWYRQYLGE